MADIIQIDADTWRFEDGFVRFFLLVGKEKAVMIDSGINCPNAADLANKLTCFKHYDCISRIFIIFEVIITSGYVSYINLAERL